MATRTVTRDQLDDALKRIYRFGTERVTNVETDDDGFVTITTDRLTDGKMETR